MERGKLSRADFMGEIRRLTTEIVNKVKNHQGGEIEGNYEPLDVACPKCGAKPMSGDFQELQVQVTPDCGFTVWKTVASRELERSEVIEADHRRPGRPARRLPQQIRPRHFPPR